MLSHVLSVLLTGVATDVIISHHDVVFKDRPRNAAVPGNVVRNAGGTARLTRQGLVFAVIVPLALSGLIVAGVFVIVSAAVYAGQRLYACAAGSGVANVNRELARDMVWFDADPLRRMRSALMSAPGEFISRKDMEYLATFAAASSVMSTLTATILWFRVEKLPRRYARVMNAVFCALIACFVALDMT